MSRAIPFLKEIIAKARIAETLATHSETKQVLVEIRLAAKCAIAAERKPAVLPKAEVYHD